MLPFSILRMRTPAPAVVNLLTNGDFATDTAWTKGSGWTISGGTANRANTGIAGSLTQSSVPYVNASNVSYRLTYTISSISGANITPRIGSSNGTTSFDSRSSAGTYQQTVVAAPNHGAAAVRNFNFSASSDTACVIDNVILEVV